MKYSEITTDVLIIGSGAAGLRTAIELSSLKKDCLVIGKSKLGDAHTILATGGINAALGNMDPKDSWQQHAADTIKEGGLIGDPYAIEKMCKEAPNAIKDLEKYGMRFHREKNGKIGQRFFGAAVYRRACFYGDQTGKEILRSLLHEAKKRKIKFKNKIYITKLFKKNKKIAGALGINLKTGKFVLFKAKVIVLAMGGYSRIYKRSSSRIYENTGDPITLALDIGVSVKDMEMTQFHPTGMVWPQKAEGVLVTEAVRGEGGRLYNTKKERFLKKYDPVRLELGPRDEVARSIYKEVKKGNGTKKGGVYLDISHRSKNYIKQRLPRMYKQFIDYLNLDISKRKMEVAPTSHYSMGGILINFKTMETNIKGLLAVGESTAGIHGGNRLGGNSLLECIVFGKHAGMQASQIVKTKKENQIKKIDVEKEIKRIESIFNSKKKSTTKLRDLISLREKIQEIMWNYAGIERSERGLLKGKFMLKKLKKDVESIHIKESVKNSEIFSLWADIQNLILPCETTIFCALKRKESRGAHYRSDYLKRNKRFQGNYLCSKEGKKIVVKFHPGKKPSKKVQKTLKCAGIPSTKLLE